LGGGGKDKSKGGVRTCKFGRGGMGSQVGTGEDFQNSNPRRKKLAKKRMYGGGRTPNKRQTYRVRNRKLIKVVFQNLFNKDGWAMIKGN